MSESRQHLSAYTKNEKSKAESIRHGSKDCQYERRDSRDDRKDSRYDSRGRHEDRNDSRYDSRGRHDDRKDSRYDSRGRHEDRNDSHYDRRDSRHESRDSPYGRRNSVRDVKNHHHVQKPEPRKLTSHVHPSQRSDQRYPTRVPGDQMLNQGPRSGAPGCGSCVAFPNSSNGTCDSCGKVCRVGSHHDVQGRKCCTGCWDRWWSEKDRNVRSAMMASERDSLKRRLPCKTVEWNALQVELQNTFVYQYNLCIEKDENVREIMRKKLILSYLRCVLDKEYLRSLDIILSGNVFYCIEDIREKLQEPLLREVGLGSFKTTIELRISETSRLQLNPRTNEEQSLQVYNHVLGKIFESLNLKRSGKVYCDETRQRVYRDMIIVPGYFATLQMSPMGIVLVVHPRTRVQATMTALEWMKRAEFSSRDLLGRKVIASYGARQRQYIVYKIDKESTPESTFELKSGATISYAQYYLDNYGVTVTDMRQPLLWGERSGRVRLIPELVLVDQLSSEARRCLPSRCSKMPLEIRNECVALANRLTESTPKEMFSTYGLNVDASKLLRVEPKLLKPVRIMLSGVCDNIRPHCDFGSQTLRIVLKEERRPFLVIAWGDKSKDVVSRILGVNERINGVLKVHGDVRYVGGSEEHSDFIDQCIDSVKTADARASSEQGVPILVLCVLKNGHSIRGSEAYGTLKYELGQLGIMSHFMDYEKISKTRSLEPYIHNVTKNITSKMGVPLWNVDLPQLIPCLQGGTLYVGYDIFSDRRSDGTDSGVFECQIRSIAGYVAWFHRDDGKWLHFCDTDMQIEKQRIETFNDDFHPITKSCDVPMTSLRDFVTEVIKAIVCGSTVSRIVVYRDSVSDSMIERVRSNEMNALEASLPNTVAMTFLVVQKRVHDRYAAQVRVGPNTEWHNVPRGHVIEHTEDCFSCIAVDCTLAAAKPIKYFILRSGGMQRDDIHNMTYALCWMYQNWPGSIKVPFVLQCAHKLAFFHGTSSAAKPNVEFNLRKMPYYL